MKVYVLRRSILSLVSASLRRFRRVTICLVVIAGTWATLGVRWASEGGVPWEQIANVQAVFSFAPAFAYLALWAFSYEGRMPRSLQKLPVTGFEVVTWFFLILGVIPGIAGAAYQFATL